MEHEKFAMKRIDIRSIEEADAAMREIETTEAGIRIMREKAIFAPVRMTALDTRAANILKQTYLSKGGEVAVSKYSAEYSKETTDVLIFATLAQHRAAIRVLRQQPWGLADVAKALQDILSL